MAYSSTSSQGLETIPNFLRAKSPQGLRRLMRRNNLRHKAFVPYTIMWNDTEKSWYAWFYIDQLKLTVEEQGEIDGITD